MSTFQTKGTVLMVNGVAEVRYPIKEPNSTVPKNIDMLVSEPIGLQTRAVRSNTTEGDGDGVAPVLSLTGVLSGDVITYTVNSSDSNADDLVKYTIVEDEIRTVRPNEVITGTFVNYGGNNTSVSLELRSNLADSSVVLPVVTTFKSKDGLVNVVRNNNVSLRNGYGRLISTAPGISSEDYNYSKAKEYDVTCVVGDPVIYTGTVSLRKWRGPTPTISLNGPSWRTIESEGNIVVTVGWWNRLPDNDTIELSFNIYAKDGSISDSIYSPPTRVIRPTGKEGSIVITTPYRKRSGTTGGSMHITARLDGATYPDGTQYYGEYKTIKYDFKE